MEKRKDILGTVPGIGDTIIYNPPQYKGLKVGKCIGFVKSGLPMMEFTEVETNMKGESRSYTYKETPKTGFVVRKDENDSEIEKSAAIKFGRWILKNTQGKIDNSGCLCHLYNGKEHTTEEIYKEYLKEKI